MQPWICPVCNRGLSPLTPSCDHGGIGFIPKPTVPKSEPRPLPLIPMPWRDGLPSVETTAGDPSWRVLVNQIAFGPDGPH